MLPAIRSELAKELVKRRISQREVSEIFGITQAAVSQYLSEKRGSKTRIDQASKKEIKKLADEIADGNAGEDVITCSVCRICMSARKRGVLDKVP